MERGVTRGPRGIVRLRYLHANSARQLVACGEDSQLAARRPSWCPSLRTDLPASASGVDDVPRAAPDRRDDRRRRQDLGWSARRPVHRDGPGLRRSPARTARLRAALLRLLSPDRRAGEPALPPPPPALPSELARARGAATDGSNRILPGFLGGKRFSAVRADDPHPYSELAPFAGALAPFDLRFGRFAEDSPGRHSPEGPLRVDATAATDCAD